MTPTVIHRYRFAVPDAIKALVGEARADPKRWSLRLVDGEIVIEAEVPAEKDAEPAVNAKKAKVSPAAEDDRKGGRLARRSAIIGGEPAFLKFIAAKHEAYLESAEDAKEWIRETCGVESRALLDHDYDAGKRFEAIDAAYALWLDGYE